MRIEGAPTEFDFSEATIDQDRVLGIYGTGTGTLETVAVFPIVADASGERGSEWKTTIGALNHLGHDLQGEFLLRRDGYPGGLDEDRGLFQLSGPRQWKSLYPIIGDPYVGTLEIRVAPGTDFETRTSWLAQMGDKNSCGTTTPIPMVDPRRRGYFGDQVLSYNTVGYGYAGFVVTGYSHVTLGVYALETGVNFGTTCSNSPAIDVPPRTFQRFRFDDICPYGAPAPRIAVNRGAGIFYLAYVDDATNALTLQVIKAMEDWAGNPLAKRCGD